MTSKEISQRLKEVGFDDEYQWGWIETTQGLQLVYIPKLTGDETASERKKSIHSYDAETLFKWLRGNVCAWEMFHDSIEVYFKVLSIDGQKDVKPHEIQYKTSLADMLGEAIIWIKEQENE